MTVDTVVAGSLAELSAGVSRHSPVPLHHQLRNALLQQIQSGLLRPGEQIPREREYAAHLGISLAPVRQALLDLVREGYLHRVRGRGTFVREPKVEETISLLGSFTEGLRRQGLEPDVVVLHQGLDAATSDIRSTLAIRQKRLFCLRRLAAVRSSPLAVLTAWLDPSRFPGLLGHDFVNASLYETLFRRYGVTMSRATNTIEVVHCDAEQASLLELSPGAPALRVEGVTYDQGNTPVEFSSVLYQADRFKFAIDSHRVDDQVMHLIGAPVGKPAVPSRAPARAGRPSKR